MVIYVSYNTARAFMVKVYKTKNYLLRFLSLKTEGRSMEDRMDHKCSRSFSIGEVSLGAYLAGESLNQIPAYSG